MNDREIEKKWIVPITPAKFAGHSASLARELLDIGIVDAHNLLYADSLDNYWRGAERAKADIVRLRHSWGHTQAGQPRSLKEFTVKHKDQGSNFDRLELNNAVESIESFRRSLSLALGSPMFSLRKDEVIAFLPSGVVISLARVASDKSAEEAVVFEIEAPTPDLIEATEQLLRSKGLMRDYQPTQLSLLEVFNERE